MWRYIYGINGSGQTINGYSIDMMIGNIITDKEIQDRVGYDKYDIVVANILADVIIPMCPVIPDRLKDGGLFIKLDVVGLLVVTPGAVSATLDLHCTQILNLSAGDVQDGHCPLDPFSPARHRDSIGSVDDKCGKVEAEIQIAFIRSGTGRDGTAILPARGKKNGGSQYGYPAPHLRGLTSSVSRCGSHPSGPEHGPRRS